MFRSLLFLIVSYCTWEWVGKKFQFQSNTGLSDLAQRLSVLDKEKLLELWNAATAADIAMLTFGLLMALTTVVTTYGLPLLMFRVGTRGNGFWSFIAGCLGAGLFTLIWMATVNQSLAPFWILTILAGQFWARVLVVAAKPSFSARGGAVRVEVEGLVVSVTSETRVRVFPVGLIALQRSPEIFTYQETAGGSYMSHQQVSVTNPDGSTGYGSVSVPVNAPHYQVTRRRKTGATEYTFTELGPDHGLQVARKPAGVQIIGRDGSDSRISFCLRGLDRLRFDYWCKFHPQLFFSSNNNDAHRVKDAVVTVMKELKGKHGKPAVHDLNLDHNLQVASLIALYKDKAVVIRATATPAIEQVLDIAGLVRSYNHVGGYLEVGGERFWISNNLRVQIERRVKVAMAHGVA